MTRGSTLTSLALSLLFGSAPGCLVINSKSLPEDDFNEDACEYLDACTDLALDCAGGAGLDGGGPDVCCDYDEDKAQECIDALAELSCEELEASSPAACDEVYSNCGPCPESGDQGDTMDETMGDSTMTGSTMTGSTMTGSTMTDTGSTMTGSTDTDTDTDTDGDPDDLAIFISTVMDLDPDDPIVTQITSSAIPIATGNDTELGDCSQLGAAMAPCDIDEMFGAIITSLPNPPSGGGFLQANNRNMAPLGPGPYYISGFSTVDPLPVNQPNRTFTLASVVSTPGGENWTSQGFDCDFYIGYSHWQQLQGMTDSKGVPSVSYTLTTPISSTPTELGTSGRAFVGMRHAFFITPVSELGGMDPTTLRVSLHFHDGIWNQNACTDHSGEAFNE